MKYFNYLVKRIKFNCSADYWERRYRKGRTSGEGSYGRLADFKAEFINDFVGDNDINSVIELGCGDGNQLALAKYPKYIGVDISKTVIKHCKSKFSNDDSKVFYVLGKEPDVSCELGLSLDVIYHLVEDSSFEKYITTLFKYSTKYVVIYSSNSEKMNEQNDCIHVKHRKFTDYVENNIKEWKMIKTIPNKFPQSLSDNKETSFADFHIFQKAN